jgi:hypothetical protein
VGVGAGGGGEVACELGFRLGEGVDDGDGAGWALGATRGSALLAWPCQDRATYPPSGTFNEATPNEEYFQVPDLPSDHHTDQ